MLRIEPKFRDLIPPLTEAEQRRLEENILDAGQIYEPIVVWNGTIIDGHHRYEIAMKYPNITWSTREIDFANEYAAMAWACNNQLGRRNLTDAQKTYLIGKRFDNEKMATSFHGNQHTNAGNSGGCQNGPTKPEPPRGRTAERLAKEYGVGQGTVNRASDFARGVDIADEIEPGIKDSVLSGEIKVPKSTIQQISRAEPEQQEQAVKYIMDGKLDSAREILNSKEENGTKVCAECKRELPLSEFYKSDGYHKSVCKSCYNSREYGGYYSIGITGEKYKVSSEYTKMTYADVVKNFDEKKETTFLDTDFVEEFIAIFDGFEKSVERCISIHDDLGISDACKSEIINRMEQAKISIEKWEANYGKQADGSI